MKNNQLNFDFDDAPIQPISSNPVDRTNKVGPNSPLTADEVKNMGATPKSEPVVASPVKSEPTPSGEFSNAALEIMRRMQKAEATAPKKVETETATYTPPSEPSEMGAFLNRHQSAPVEVKKVETVAVKTAEPVSAPVVEEPIVVPVVDNSLSVEDKRREKAYAFKLDIEAMAAGFENIEGKGYATAQDAVTDLINGNIYAVVVDEAPANALVKAANN